MYVSTVKEYMYSTQLPPTSGTHLPCLLKFRGPFVFQNWPDCADELCSYILGIENTREQYLNDEIHLFSLTLWGRKFLVKVGHLLVMGGSAGVYSFNVSPRSI